LIEPHWLMVYGGNDIDGKSDGDSEVDGGDYCLESADPMSDSLSGLYSQLDVFLYKS